MAKVKKFSTFCDRPSGGYQKIDVDINVDTKGMFYAKIPDELLDFAEKYANSPESKTRTSRIGNDQKIFASNLDDLEYFLSSVNRLKAKDELKVEVVILYRINNHVAYYKYPDGKIEPTGGGEKNHNKPTGEWHGIEGREQGNNYSVQLYAKVVVKISQANSDKVKWDRPENRNHGPDSSRNRPESVEMGEYAEKLNSFNNLGWPKDFCHDESQVNPKHCVEIPYTEERAKFFHDMLIGMCKLADKFSVLQDEKVLLKLADSGASFLLTDGKK
jgi:hypothetical protein